jgi:hypothetical protein
MVHGGSGDRQRVFHQSSSALSAKQTAHSASLVTEFVPDWDTHAARWRSNTTRLGVPPGL